MSSIAYQLKDNMMAGSPTRSKREGDYPGLSIPPCGDFMATTTSIPRPPWLHRSSNLEGSRVSEKISLSKEIGYFMNYMTPSPKETAARKDLVKRFIALIESFDENITVIPVGSYVTGLYLPTSDIDMVLTRRNKSLYAFASVRMMYPKILHSGFASKVDTVFNASVPVIKVTDKITGIEIDLSAADTLSIKATKAVAKWLQSDTEITKMLVFVIKTFLTIRRCGTTFTGGINSYVLVWMVVAWVKLEWPKIKRTNVTHSSRAADVSSLTALLGNLSVRSDTVIASKPAVSTPVSRTHDESSPCLDYGAALRGFLDFYGQRFDYYKTTISIEPAPCYKVKSYVYPRHPTQSFLLSIFDPADETINMGEKAYGINHIKASFREAYMTIISAESSAPGRAGVLGRMLGGDFTTFVEKRNSLTHK